MISFIDTYKSIYGVEPICTILNENIDGGFLTPSGYYRAKKRVPAARTLKDQLLIPELTKIYEENYGVYGGLFIRGSKQQKISAPAPEENTLP